MWIHQRTGPNSGVSYGPFVVGLFAFGLLALVVYGWPLLLVVVALAALVVWSNFRSHQRHRAQGQRLTSCNYCRRQIAELQKREQLQREQAEWYRLQDKYRDAS